MRADGLFSKVCRCGCEQEFLTKHSGQTIQKSCAIRTANIRRATLAFKATQKKKQTVLCLCVCGCGNHFEAKTRSHKIRPECRLEWSRKKSRESQQRKRDEARKFSGPPTRPVADPISPRQLQRVPVEKFEKALRRLVR